MPNGYVAPGWVLPTCGFGHHQVSARPCGIGRSVTELPMNGSTCSIKVGLLGSDCSARCRSLGGSRFAGAYLVVAQDEKRVLSPLLGTAARSAVRAPIPRR